MRYLLLLLVLAGCASTQIAPAPTMSAPGPAILRDSAEAGPDIQAAAYIRIRNASAAPDRLVRVSCACADSVEIHNTYDGDMHTLPSLEIPAQGDLDIRPGGPTHLMLMGVRQPIAVGERVTIRFEFEHAEPVSAELVAVPNSREGWDAQAR